MWSPVPLAEGPLGAQLARKLLHLVHLAWVAKRGLGGGRIVLPLLLLLLVHGNTLGRLAHGGVEIGRCTGPLAQTLCDVGRETMRQTLPAFGLRCAQTGTWACPPPRPSCTGFPLILSTLCFAVGLCYAVSFLSPCNSVVILLAVFCGA